MLLEKTNKKKKKKMDPGLSPGLDSQLSFPTVYQEACFLICKISLSFVKEELLLPQSHFIMKHKSPLAWCWYLVFGWVKRKEVRWDSPAEESN